jgi:RNA-directed DNA polymerase
MDYPMKTYKHLYPQICSFQNLLSAFWKARRHKSAKPDVAAFEFDLEQNLLQLEEELLSETYCPGSYRNFYVFEPKKRLVSAAHFRDKVVHHALVNIIEPIWEPRFIHDSYACRKGKGFHRAVDRAHYFLRRHRYALKGDIVRFFPSVDHQVLMDILGRRIADPATMRLIGLILQSGEGVLDDEYIMTWFPGDDLLGPIRPRGLPIGNLTSQFWANVYLNELDQFIKRDLKCGPYLRYADDLLLFDDDKARLWAWCEEVSYCLGGLRLRLHQHKTVVFPVKNGVDWLGFRLFPTHRRLRRENVRRAVRRLKRQQAAYARGELTEEQLSRSVHSWIAHACFADTEALRRRVLGQFAFVAHV